MEQWMFQMCRFDMKRIKLTQNKHALVDDVDYGKLMEYNWGFDHGYVRSTKKIYMHRLIMNPIGEQIIDHINGNKLDNRKSNLRICSRKQNQSNQAIRTDGKSKYKGVSINRKGTWVSKITNLYIGTFENELHAAMAYDIAAKDLFGNYAKLNFK